MDIASPLIEDALLNSDRFLADRLTDLNPDPKVPCVVVVDTSGSMEGAPILEQQSGLAAIPEEFRKDKLASLRTELAVVTFGGTVEVVQDFIHPDQFKPPTLHASGATPMAEAIHKAYDLIDARRKEYRRHDLDSYGPWIFMVTDGAPTDPEEAIQQASERIRVGEKMPRESRIAFFPIGVENADMRKLSEISVRTPLKLKGLQFSSLFRWLSRSLIQVSKSRIGDGVKLIDPRRDGGWAEV